MKKKKGWVRSASICAAVVLVMLGAGFYLVVENVQPVQVSSKVEAASNEQTVSEQKEKKVAEQEVVEEEEKDIEVASVEDEKEEKPDENKADESTVQAASTSEEDIKAAEKPEPAVEEKMATSASAEETATAPADHSAQQEEEKTSASQPVEVASAPVTEPEPAVVVETTSAPVAAPEPTVAPVSYNWGSSGSYTFRMEVKVTNNGSDTSRNVMVSVPLLTNDSPYQTTSLKSVNYNVVSTSGRVSTFDLGDMAPGETKTIVADFAITVRTVSLNSSNETVEKARVAYDLYKGSGNCRTLALGFIGKAREMGLEAREVIGFARPERGAMTSGSLQGCRHSWAEFYVDGLGWVPVDLTFQYFGEFPHASHIVESYSDQSITVNFSGGSLGASWSNSIR